jgi:hypothetical protein
MRLARKNIVAVSGVDVLHQTPQLQLVADPAPVIFQAPNPQKQMID